MHWLKAEMPISGALINAWSGISVNENQYGEVFRLLGKNELHDKNALPLKFYALVKNNSKPCSYSYRKLIGC